MKKVWNKIKSHVGKSRRQDKEVGISANAEIIPSSAHNISSQEISPAALKVLHRLNDSGYSAYLVGGGVRDLLLGKHPKDFDVTTDASPEQIRRVFSNSRIIGRRFRLVHVRYGREIVEVATFRGHGVDTAAEVDLDEDLDLLEDLEPVENDEDFPARRQEDHPSSDRFDDERSHNQRPGDQRHLKRPTGVLASDNVYGTMEEDASRRDFTVNALFYCVKDSSVIDYCQGMRDLAAKQIRVIGNPEKRYREDPVRMLRAARLAAKLDFTIEKNSAAPIADLANLLSHVPPARLYDELVKMIVGGHSLPAFDLLQHYGLFEYLFPQTYASLFGQQGEMALRLIKLALKETDARIAAEKSINPAFMIAILLWEPLQERMQFHESEGNNLYVAMQLAQNDVVREQLRCFSAPRRVITTVREIWTLQYQLVQTRKHRVLRAYEHPRFRAGYDFLLLRAKAGEPLESLGDWWTRFQNADVETQEAMMDDLQNSQGGSNNRNNSSRRRRPRKNPR
jgi:poly(A) polymerase